MALDNVSTEPASLVEVVPGDWPPSGSRIRWVALVLDTPGGYAVVDGPDGRAEWPAAALRAGEVPLDAVRRVGSDQLGAAICWAVPVATLTVSHRQYTGAATPALLVFRGRPERDPREPIRGMPPGEVAGVVYRIPGGEVVCIGAEACSALAKWLAECDPDRTPPALVTEIKNHIHGPPSFFHCTAVRLGREDVLLRYVTRREGLIRDMAVPAGSVTQAYYAQGADCVPWRVCGPVGNEICTLIHVADQVRVCEDRVSYRDLLVDVLVEPGGTPQILDRDELEQALADGLLSQREAHGALAVAERIAADPTRALEGLGAPS